MPEIPFDPEVVGRRFAPRVYFHREESFLPSRVPWFLERVQLFHITPLHARRVPAPYLFFDKRNVTADKLVRQERGDDKSWKKRSCGAFWLKIPTDDDQWTTRFGDLSTATCYCHIQPSKKTGRWWLAYFFFYPFNGSIVIPLEITHEGDWEHVKVEVDRRGSKIYRVWYAAHTCGAWHTEATSDGEGFKLAEETHPVVYSARHSHASYPRAGKQERFPASDWTGRGKKMDCWKGGNFALLGNKRNPSPEQAWIKFGGYWGDLGWGIGIIPDRGPMGPAYKDWWKDC